MTISTPVQALTDDREALVAVAMNGEPLPTVHGFPARLVTPGLYGFVGATKWLTRLQATTYAGRAPTGPTAAGPPTRPILTQSRIDTPRGLNRLDAGRVVIGGVAWAQHRGIEKVEVRVDGGAVAGGQARPRRRHRLLAPVVPALGRPSGPARADGARDRPQRRRPARAARRPRSPRARRGWHIDRRHVIEPERTPRRRVEKVLRTIQSDPDRRAPNHVCTQADPTHVKEQFPCAPPA